MSVYTWRDRRPDPRAAGGFVVVDLAVAADGRDGLRRACERAGVSRPSRPARARHDEDVVQIALAHPGTVLVLGPKDPHWATL